jgi:SAM-dependent methyltransferase
VFPSQEDIERFYDAPLGRAAVRLLTERLTALWPSLAGERCLALGEAERVLRDLAADTAAIAAAHTRAPEVAPAELRGTGNARLLVDLLRMPFEDQCFSRAVMLHTLEDVENAHRMLREIWRIMEPEGRLLVIASNRSGLWSRTEHTPFGHGRPYTRRQLSQLLEESLFEPTAWSHALFVPPIPWRVVASTAGAWEKAGETFWPALGGVVMVEAVKRLAVPPGNRAPVTAKVGVGVRAANGNARRD